MPQKSKKAQREPGPSAAHLPIGIGRHAEYYTPLKICQAFFKNCTQPKSSRVASCALWPA